MKKIMVFGKPGSGKSTLSKRLASTTQITLYALDSIEFTPDGNRVDRESITKPITIYCLAATGLLDLHHFGGY